MNLAALGLAVAILGRQKQIIPIIVKDTLRCMAAKQYLPLD